MHASILLLKPNYVCLSFCCLLLIIDRLFAIGAITGCVCLGNEFEKVFASLYRNITSSPHLFALLALSFIQVFCFFFFILVSLWFLVSFFVLLNIKKETLYLSLNYYDFNA